MSVKAGFKQEWDIIRLGLPEQKWVNYGRKMDWEQKALANKRWAQGP